MAHYDALIAENNDPARDGPQLKRYMDRWDGEEFFRLMAPSPTECALEIGVGSGRLALRCAPLWKKLYGIDLSLPTIQRARENLASHSNVQLICADFLSYDFPCRFDCIYSSLTFMHIQEKKAAIEKAAELLNAGGRLLLSLDKSRDPFLPSPTGKLALYPDDPQLLLSLFTQAGLTTLPLKETEAATLLFAKKN